jgi:NADH dehydrogenase [ubiquinone] 1 alpha subcomplex assembly factor 3
MLSVHSMGESNFTLSDGLVCRSPIMLLHNNVFLWDAPALGDPTQNDPLKQVIMPNGKGWEAWTEDAWRLIEVASPRPEIVIFGTGKTVCPPPPSVRTFLNSLGVQVEAHSTRNACSTYNMLAEEGRLVAAALLPNIRQPIKRLKATEQAQQKATDV